MQEYLSVLHNFCRTCMRIPKKLIALADDPNLPHKITVISSISIDTNVQLPQKICEECVKNINFCYNFRNVIINNDSDMKERLAASLIKQVENNSSLSTSPTPTEPELTCLQQKNNTVEECEEPRVIMNQTAQVILRTRLANVISKQRLRDRMTYRKKSYECKPCGFVCNERSSWQQHKRTQHYARICNICGKSIRSDNLNKHIRSHTEEPITCQQCGKVLKNSESLRSHAMIHNGPELLCPLCGKSYKYRGEYNRHMKRHNSNGRKTIKCPMCDKLFYDKKHIKQHIRSHTGERPYICSYCEKGFTSTYALKTHIRQHTNEKPYVCGHCPMAFPQKVSLMTHIKSKHLHSNAQTL